MDQADSQDAPAEEELIARWQAGDDGALGLLLAPHIDALRSHLTRRFDAQIAEEAVSEVTYKLARRPAYEHRGSFRAWLQTVGRRAAIDVIRRNRRLSRIAENAEAEFDGIVTHGAERKVRDVRRGQRVDRHLSDLPTLHRAAVRMRYWQGASTEEIAEALSLTSTQVRDRLSYALRAMRKKLRSLTLD